MRKSNNYFKFLEYVTYGKDHDNTIDKGNGVLECTSYVSISDIEHRYKTTFGLENECLILKNILINEDTLYVYYLDGENSELVAVYLLNNFKTQKKLKDSITTTCVEFLYELLLEKSDVREDKEKHYFDYTSEDCIENAECSSGNDVFDGYFDTDTLQSNKTIIEKIENINHCPNQNTCCIVSPFVHCDYNYKSDACIKAHKNFIHDCEQVHKQMKARSNPEWHHVNLETFRNIDFDMLDEKRQIYFSLYREWKETVKNLRKCSCGHSYERCYANFRAAYINAFQCRKISKELVIYFDRKISMCNVECGVWSSAVEVATGQHESRKYNRATLRY